MLSKQKELVKSYLGKTVDIKIDRPLGSIHHEYKNIIYPVNYGCIPNEFVGDNEKIDVYLIGVNEPVKEFRAKIIGIIHRKNDIKDKLVAAPDGMIFNQAEIQKAVHFEKQYFDTEVETIYWKSCGAIVYRETEQGKEYLLLYQNQSKTWSFPKGRMKMGESEIQTATREIFEETGIKVELDPNTREEITVTYPDKSQKTIVFFLKNTNAKPLIDKKEIIEYRYFKAEEAKKLLPKQYVKLIDDMESNND